jgi:transposase
LAAAKKGALKRGAWLLHLDESGFSQRPSIVRTWAPKGCTPILRMAYNWKRLSVTGALAVAPDLSRVRTFLSPKPGSVDGPTVIAFLRSVRRLLRAPVLLVWDRLPAHVSGLVKNYLTRQRHWLDVEWLPPYAPELNPVEYLWSYLDGTDLANFAPDDLRQLERQVRRGIRRVRRKDDLALAFLKHSGLYPELYKVLCETQ